MKKLNINPNDFKDVDHVAKVRNWYPNLYTQASDINRRIQDVDDEMYKVVNEITSWEGYDAVERLLDASYNYIQGEAEISKDLNSIEPDDIKNIAGEVFNYNALAKGLLDLLRLKERLINIESDIELTNHKVLL